MDANRIATLLANAQAIVQDDHFVYSDGAHGPGYVNKDRLYLRPEITSEICASFARDAINYSRMADRRPHAVVGPAMGGILLASWTAYHMQCLGVPTLALYAEKESDQAMVLRRGYDREVADKDVIVVEDIINSGKSARQTVKAVRAAGGRVLLVLAICNRGNADHLTLNVDLVLSLLDINMVRYPEAACPLCKAGIPVNQNLGHGRKFVEKKRGAP